MNLNNNIKNKTLKQIFLFLIFFMINEIKKEIEIEIGITNIKNPIEKLDFEAIFNINSL